MNKQERLEEWLDNLSDGDLVAIWNEFMYDDSIWSNDDYTLNEFFNEYEPYEILCRTFYGEYNLNHDWFYVNGYGNLVSFNNPKSDVSPIYIPELAEQIIDSDNDNGYGEIRDILDSDDFEESVRRTTRRPKRISKESIRKNRRRYRK